MCLHSKKMIYFQSSLEILLVKICFFVSSNVFYFLLILQFQIDREGWLTLVTINIILFPF